MHRFYLPPERCRTSDLVLTGSEAHHALHVLRVAPGERVTVLNGAGHEFSCTVRNQDREKLTLTVEEKRVAAPPAAQITLLQAIPKGKIIEAIIQKATELGAARIVPLLTERVATRLDEREATRKTSKWQLIAIEAIKQCGNPWLPQVEVPVTPADFISRKEHFDLPLLASLQGETQHPRVYFDDFRKLHGRNPASVCVWIGPEGDLTPAEVTATKAWGARPITLGPLILRTETAATYCLSVINHEIQSENNKAASISSDAAA
jgi:16S rRNA (uracil1498-N3)-methyltransferase